jgi:uncharacterized membrane protein YeaQ/YmgE (transglycosylase-associated protein family)
VSPQHLLGWLIIGLIAGAVASRVVVGKGYGCAVNLIVGLAGAFIGGAIIEWLHPRAVVIDGFIDELIVAFLGAALLLAVLRLVSGNRR